MLEYIHEEARLVEGGGPSALGGGCRFPHACTSLSLKQIGAHVSSFQKGHGERYAPLPSPGMHAGPIPGGHIFVAQSVVGSYCGAFIFEFVCNKKKMTKIKNMKETM
jgi:hypothetical protein